MANYIAWYGKKRERLAEHECAFLRLLRKGASMERLRKAAETVRLAHIRVLKAKQAQLPPSEKSAAAIANLDREIQPWLALTADDVIEGYRSGTLRRPRATAAPHPQ